MWTGKLLKFIGDLHSGKLHQEFHYGPSDPNEDDEDSDENGGGGGDHVEGHEGQPQPTSEEGRRK